MNICMKNIFSVAAGMVILLNTAYAAGDNHCPAVEDIKAENLRVAEEHGYKYNALDYKAKTSGGDWVGETVIADLKFSGAYIASYPAKDPKVKTIFCQYTAENNTKNMGTVMTLDSKDSVVPTGGGDVWGKEEKGRTACILSNPILCTFK